MGDDPTVVVCINVHHPEVDPIYWQVVEITGKDEFLRMALSEMIGGLDGSDDEAILEYWAADLDIPLEQSKIAITTFCEHNRLLATSPLLRGVRYIDSVYAPDETTALVSVVLRERDRP